jgi:hypothetical protein
MNVSRQIREQIDACRPGSDDLALPELAEVAAAVEQDGAVAAELARSQRFDQAVSVAMHELPLPAGLAERVLAALEANKLSPAPAPPGADSARGWSRRRWLTLAVSLAALLLIAVTARQFIRGTPRQITQEDLSQAVAAWDAAVASNPWVKSPVPVTVPKGINVPPGAGWQTVLMPPGCSGNAVAINLIPPGGKARAMLVVVSSTAKFNAGPRPAGLTLSRWAGSIAAAAWQSRDSNVLYVLIVHTDDPQGWRNFLPKTTEA